jgi:hypothetical protein
MKKMKELSIIADRYNIQQTDENTYSIKPDENTTIIIHKPFQTENNKWTVTITKKDEWVMLWKKVNYTIVKL